MDLDLEPSQQLIGGPFEALYVIPPPVAGKLTFEVSPQAFNEVELWGVGREPKRLEAIRMLLPPGTQFVTLVGARVIEHHERGRAFLLTALVDHPSTRVL
jgi:hypothetical protein